MGARKTFRPRETGRRTGFVTDTSDGCVEDLQGRGEEGTHPSHFPCSSRDRTDITRHHAAPLPDRGVRIRSAAAGVEPIALCAQPVAHG